MYKKLIYLTCFGMALGFVQINIIEAADPNLVGWWKFDETSGTVAADSSGSGNDAYFNGSLDEFRIYDRALSIEEILFLAGR